MTRCVCAHVFCDISYALKSHKQGNGQQAFRLQARLHSVDESLALLSMTSSMTFNMGGESPKGSVSPSSTAAVNFSSTNPFGSPMRSSNNENLVEALDDDFHWQKGKVFSYLTFLVCVSTCLC